MDASLLDLVCCPETHQLLRFATTDELTKLSIENAVVREDGRIAYPIRDGIPLLIVEEQLTLS